MQDFVINKVKRVIKEICLLNQTKHTARDLAKLLNTSVRTIQRDLKDIESLEIYELKKMKRDYKLLNNKTKLITKVKVKSTITKKEEKEKEKEEFFYSEITKNSGILKKDKADMWFYYIKDSNNKITYVSDKFETKGKAKKDLELAI